MQDPRQMLFASRVGKFTAILSSSTLSLLLVGAGCSPAPTANVSVDAEVPAVIPPAETTPADGTNLDVNVDVEVAPVSKKYNDGSYSADGYYRSPAGSERVGVTLLLEDDVVVNVTFTAHATNPKSVAMQAEFKGGISAEVVGKSLDEINVGKVAGSSLTGAGFNEAVAKIKVEAKS